MATVEMLWVSDRLILHLPGVPQVRRVFVFAPNLGYHRPEQVRIHPVRDLEDRRRLAFPERRLRKQSFE
jgi:hypothetical protein